MNEQNSEKDKKRKAIIFSLLGALKGAMGVIPDG